MALDLEQDDTRDDKAEHFRELLVQIDSNFTDLQNTVDQLTAFRQEVTDNTDGIYVAEDLPKVTQRLTERRDAIVAWANALPGA
jgi:hypothetical protein